jgi:hypothetical protein
MKRIEACGPFGDATIGEDMIGCHYRGKDARHCRGGDYRWKYGAFREKVGVAGLQISGDDTKRNTKLIEGDLTQIASRDPPHASVAIE